MSITFGPKIGKIVNAGTGESYTYELRNLLRSYDALVQGSVLDTSLSAPPGSPSNGDAYIIVSVSPTGAWTGKTGKVAVYSTEITPPNTDTKAPGWEFYSPRAGWQFYSTATKQFWTFDGTQWLVMQQNTLNFGATEVPVTNLRLVTGANRTAMASGDTDLYTVPANKKALVVDVIVSNPTGSGNSITSFAEFKSLGSYTKYDLIVASLVQASYGVSGLLIPMLLAAGESFSMNNSASGLSAWPFILEFDATSPIAISRVISFSSGDNTILTAPFAGVQLLPNLDTAGIGNLYYFNNSGGTRTINVNVVPNAGAPAVANSILQASTVAATASSQIGFYGGMSAGDFISLNTDSNSAGQIAYAIYRTLP